MPGSMLGSVLGSVLGSMLGSLVDYTGGEVEGLASCSRGASCVVEYTMGRLRDWSL